MKKIIRKILDRIIPPPITPIKLAATFVFSEGVPGDYLEFGVFKGSSFIEAVKELEFAYAKWGNQNKDTNRQAYSEDSSGKADEDFLTLDFKKQVSILHLTLFLDFLS